MKVNLRADAAFVFASLIALAVFPGIDLVAYHFLHPASYWEKFAFIAGVIITAFPLVVVSFCFFWLAVKFFMELTAS